MRVHPPRQRGLQHACGHIRQHARRDRPASPPPPGPAPSNCRAVSAPIDDVDISLLTAPAFRAAISPPCQRQLHRLGDSPNPAEPAAQELAEPLARCQRCPIADLLQADRQRQGQQRRPEHRVAELRPGLGVGGDARRVVVGCSRDQARPQRSRYGRQPVASDAVAALSTGLSRTWRCTRWPFPASGRPNQQLRSARLSGTVRSLCSSSWSFDISTRCASHDPLRGVWSRSLHGFFVCHAVLAFKRSR